MTLNTYAEVDPDAKLSTVDKIGEGFDMDLDIALPRKPETPTFTMSFTVEQLEGMLAKTRRRESCGEIGAISLLEVMFAHCSSCSIIDAKSLDQPARSEKR